MTINQIIVLAAMGFAIIFLISKRQKRAEDEIVGAPDFVFAPLDEQRANVARFSGF